MTTKKNPIHYTPEEIEKIKQLWVSGATALDISTIMQRGLTSIRNKIRALQKSGVLEVRTRPASDAPAQNTPVAALETPQDRADVLTPTSLLTDDHEPIITMARGAYELPDGYVEYFVEEIIRLMGEEAVANTSLFSDMVTECCTAWYTQSAECYYLGPVCEMTIEPSPTQAVLMTGSEGEFVFVSRAMARMRGTLTHSAFVKICEIVATAWS